MDPHSLLSSTAKTTDLGGQIIVASLTLQSQGVRQSFITIKNNLSHATMDDALRSKAYFTGPHVNWQYESKKHFNG